MGGRRDRGHSANGLEQLGLEVKANAITWGNT
jgi:hypothetical protein